MPPRIVLGRPGTKGHPGTRAHLMKAAGRSHEAGRAPRGVGSVPSGVSSARTFPRMRIAGARTLFLSLGASRGVEGCGQRGGGKQAGARRWRRWWNGRARLVLVAQRLAQLHQLKTREMHACMRACVRACARFEQGWGNRVGGGEDVRTLFSSLIASRSSASCSAEEYMLYRRTALPSFRPAKMFA